MANEVETTPEAPQISIADLQNLLRIVDVAAERGTFKGNELSSVGGVRDKLATFIDSVTPKEEPVEGAEPAGDEEAAG